MGYIVRIYQRDEERPGKIVGIVEKVGGEERKTFTNFEELRKILTSEEPASGQ